MYAKISTDIKSEISAFLNSYGVEAPEVNLEIPTEIKYGDTASSVALKYAKILNREPLELAQSISSHLSSGKIHGIKKIEAVKPGFINFFFDDFVFDVVVNDILKLRTNFGKNLSLQNQKWVIEHTSPNPNKAMHLGHLRNNLVGMGLVRLLSWSGAIVVSDAVDNNRGIAIAKLMWGFLAHMRKKDDVPTNLDYWLSNPDSWYTPDDYNLSADLFVTKCYVLGESDFKNNKLVEEKIRDLVVKWESGDKKTWRLWSHVLTYAYDGMQRTLTRIGNHWDKVWHEHEHYKKGKRYVQEGLKRDIFVKLEDGAVLTNLSRYGIPDTILLKRDGTSLYITQDIALTALKKKEYKAQKLIWVIGPEQSLAMKQLFAVCEQLGIGSITDFWHVSYGYVGLKDGHSGFKKMSSREGTVITIDDLIDDVKNKILQKGLDKNKENIEIDSIKAEKMALAAVKFSFLKSDRTQDIVFDIEQSIETSGDSGIYVLYTYVRTQSILRKKMSGVKTWEKQELGLERDVVRLLMYFPDIIKKSKDDLSTHHIAQYLLELSSAFNAWYGKEVILDGTNRESYKLAVTEAVGVVIQNGFAILGIETIEEM